jgi:hypothetical protein
MATIKVEKARPINTEMNIGFLCASADWLEKWASQKSAETNILGQLTLPIRGK